MRNYRLHLLDTRKAAKLIQWDKRVHSVTVIGTGLTCCFCQNLTLANC